MSDQNPEIWQLQANFDIQGLVRALKSENAGIRKRSAAALRALGEQAALPALRQALRAESDTDARHALLAAIEALDKSPEELEAEHSSHAKTIDRLIAQLHSLNMKEVLQAIEKLAELGDKIAVEPLILLFNDLKTPIQIRLATAEALLKLESAPIEVALLANLRHPDWHIRRNGAAILGQLRAEWAIEPLGQALHDPNPTVSKTAIAALKYIGTPEARKTLAQFVSSQNAPTPSVTNDPSDRTLAVAPRDGLLQRMNELMGDPEHADATEKTSTQEALSAAELLSKVKRVSDQTQSRLLRPEQSLKKTDILDSSVVDQHESKDDDDKASE